MKKMKNVFMLLLFVIILSLSGCSFKDVKDNVIKTKDDVTKKVVEKTSEKKEEIKNDVYTKNEEVKNEVDSANNITEKLSDKIFTECTLVRVIDGDTLLVNINGQDDRVRLIGVNTPESVHPDANKNTEEGKTASNYTKSLLEKGQVLYLTKDISERDKYDRLLRFVWIEKPKSFSKDEFISKSLNGILLKNGYAEIMSIKPDITYAAILQSILN